MMKPVYINAANAVFPRTEVCYKDVIRDANMRRRMSRIVKMGVASALECLRSPEGDDYIVPDAIITASALGCLADTEKFLSEMIARDENMLNPTAFIQSTYNTVGAQIALINRIRSYNMVYVHGGCSFDAALTDALMCVSEGRSKVLLEAFDEITPSSRTLLERLGCFSEGSEGAVSFLVSDSPAQSGSVEICDVLFHGNASVRKPMNLSIDSAISLYDAVLSLAGNSSDDVRIVLELPVITLTLRGI